MNINEIISENISLKEKIALLENELTNIKQKLNTYQCNSKKYYETHKEEIKIKNSEYKKKYIPTEEQKKKWAKTAYLKLKEKKEKENNI
jgi:DNA-binding transcriptional regulator GbsR (MarR family)